MAAEKAAKPAKAGRATPWKILSAVLVVLLAAAMFFACVQSAHLNAAREALDKAMADAARHKAEEERLLAEEQARKARITGEYLSGKISTLSDLTTAQLQYSGLIHYTDGKVPFLTKKAFSMIYSADVRAGIDLSKVEITVTDTEVWLILPKAEIQTLEVKEDSIAFYDEKYALFNWTQREDVLEAVAAAKKDLYENVDTQELCDKALKQAKTLLSDFLSDIVEGRKLVIR